MVEERKEAEKVATRGVIHLKIYATLCPLCQCNLNFPAVQQVTGEAKYIDDHPPLKNELHAAIVVSSKAHARIVAIDATEALGKLAC